MMGSFLWKIEKEEGSFSGLFYASFFFSFSLEKREKETKREIALLKCQGVSSPAGDDSGRRPENLRPFEKGRSKLFDGAAAVSDVEAEKSRLPFGAAFD